jgi:hypothetical protein
MDVEYAGCRRQKRRVVGRRRRNLKEDRCKAEKAHRRAMEQEERQRESEQESMERERLEEDSECREREAAESKVIAHLYIYEEKWLCCVATSCKTSALCYAVAFI